MCSVGGSACEVGVKNRRYNKGNEGREDRQVWDTSHHRPPHMAEVNVTPWGRERVVARGTTHSHAHAG